MGQHAIKGTGRAFRFSQARAILKGIQELGATNSDKSTLKSQED